MICPHCIGELLMLAASTPIIGVLFRWIYIKWKSRLPKNAHCHNAEHEHEA